MVLRETVAKRMYEAVNGTDTTTPWNPGGWESAKICNAITVSIYYRCAG